MEPAETVVVPTSEPAPAAPELAPAPAPTEPIVSEPAPAPTEPVASEPAPAPEPAPGPSPIYLSDLSGGTPLPPRILLSDILGQLSVLQQQEANDRALFVPPNVNDIRNRLIPWVAGGMQGACDLARIWLTPPNVCSDGVSRNFFDYIAFVSGKTVAEHLKAYQDLLPEFEVGYRCSRTELVICVVRVLTA